MTQWNDTAVLEFQSGEALEQYRRVKLSGSTVRTVVYADAGEEALGVTRVAVASGKDVGIHTLNKPGTLPMIAAAAITANALVYGAADGKVTSTATGRAIGRALHATTADGDQVEVLPIMHDIFSDVGTIHGFFDDLEWYVTAHRWTLTATDSGTATQQDAAGGQVQLRPSDGSVADNDEVYFATTNELFLFANNKPLWFEARVKITEANTDDQNTVIGLMSATGANHLLDDGAGPAASYSGAVFYKVDGGTSWQAEVSIAGTQTAITLSGTGVTVDGNFHKFGIEFIPTSSTTATVNFYIDGTLVGSTTSFTYTNATEMDALVGCKNGSANNETVDIDYIHVKQVR